MTASRLRGRFEKLLDAAKANGLRDSENPARWRGHLDHLLPRPPKLEESHHAAMPYNELPGFLTSCRASWCARARIPYPDVRAALRCVWHDGEFDLARLRTVPASRMKGSVQHVVPLSQGAIDILLLVPVGRYVIGPPGPMAMYREQARRRRRSSWLLLIVPRLGRRRDDGAPKR